ncbi:MAG: ABC transporter ATP-binding protein [Propionibacteriaceae bacterium]|nr:ABC transporter ATP-binding protein [Propionibacteriaceae bacterium]
MSTMLHMTDVRKTYATGVVQVEALRGVDLDVAEGDYLAIMGPSGSGKSTLMHIIGCLDVPTSGTYLLDGTDVSEMTEKQLAEVRNRKIGFVFQQFNLLPWLSAHDNVTLALRFSARRRAQAAEGEAGRLLGGMGLADALWRRPAAQLSVGQQQRVAAARALIGRPALILADEPTSALDEDARDAFMALLLQCCAEAGSALVFVSHDARLAERFARVERLASDGVGGA